MFSLKILKKNLTSYRYQFRYQFRYNIIYILIFLLFSCSTISQNIINPNYESEVFDGLPIIEKILSEISNKNSDLNTFKGKGKLKLVTQDLSQTHNIAWICQKPTSMRIVVYGIHRMPAFAISYDGKYFYATSYSDKKFFKFKKSDANLEDIVHIPIKISSLVSLISGKIPIFDNFNAKLYKNNLTRQYILYLKEKSLFGRSEKIYLDSFLKIKKFDMFDSFDSFLYTAEFKNIKTIYMDNSKFKVPFEIIVSNKIDNFQLVVEKYWANVKLNQNIFTIKNNNE